MTCFINKAGIAVALTLLMGGTAWAVIPHEGNYTPKQMAGMVIGFLNSDEARGCKASSAAIDDISGKLTTHYGFNQDDLDAESAFGRRYVAMGRKIAAKDSRDSTFCDDVKFEIEEDSVELLPH